MERFYYDTPEEREKIIEECEGKGFTLVKIAELTDGNYLEFNTNIQKSMLDLRAMLENLVGGGE